ncbi:MAG: hypothetical protein JNJ77_13970 [Planctomycetia bacterium]|nr:hypothetical protein [Planctomycetia bacterium]
MENQVKPPQGVSGKWIVMIIIPVVILSAIWLAYNRWNFKHPTSLATPPENKTAP